jgi:uncharacterized OB-fold protein
MVDPTLLASDDPAALAGARCSECGTVVFPAQDGCPRCSHRPMDPHALAGDGVVWTWTTQQFAPKPPFRPSSEAWAPKALGYVDLGDVLVEGWLVPSARDWAIGDAVRVTTVPAWTDEDGDVHTFAFEHVEAPA